MTKICFCFHHIILLALLLSDGVDRVLARQLGSKSSKAESMASSSSKSAKSVKTQAPSISVAPSSAQEVLSNSMSKGMSSSMSKGGKKDATSKGGKKDATSSSMSKGGKKSAAPSIEPSLLPSASAAPSWEPSVLPSVSVSPSWEPSPLPSGNLDQNVIPGFPSFVIPGPPGPTPSNPILMLGNPPARGPR